MAVGAAHQDVKARTSQIFLSQLTAKQHPVSLGAYDGKRAHSEGEIYPHAFHIPTVARAIWPDEGSGIRVAGVIWWLGW